MIDLEKWKKLDDEKKFEACKTMLEVANEKATSKDDWILMCRFLLTKIGTEKSS